MMKKRAGDRTEFREKFSRDIKYTMRGMSSESGEGKK